MDQSEIEHQLNFLMNNNKQYVVGNTYNGVALTVTGTNWTTTRGVFRPQKFIDAGTKTAVYILEFNITGTISILTIAIQLTISGIVFKNVDHQGIAGTIENVGVDTYALRQARCNTNMAIIDTYFNANFNKVYLMGKVEIISWPTWADSN